MRIAIAGMHHESNTFNPTITGDSDFLLFRGSEVFSRLEEYASAKGMVDRLRAGGYEILPAAFARAVPNGVVSQAFYESFKKDVLSRLTSFGPLDGIVLALHGSMTVEGVGDAEGNLLESVRSLFPSVPLTASLDMHATVTDRMLRNADAFVGYKTAPHVDMYETGYAAADLLIRSLETGRTLQMACRKIPVLIAGEQTETSSQPTASLIALLKEVESSGEVLSASYLLGFPWADNESNGVSAVAVTLDDPATADRVSRRLASSFWERRKDFSFHTEAYPVDQALSEAFSSPQSPVFVSDSGDNPTAGSSGDSTQFLRALLSHPDLPSYRGRIGYGGFCDAESVERCRGMKGKRVELELGGKVDRGSGDPVRVVGEVLSELESWGSYGSCLVAVRVGNLDLVIADRHMGFGDDVGYWAALGLPISQYPMLCLKLGYLTEGYHPFHPRSILALSEGCSNELLGGLPFKHLRRPMFPLDQDASYEA